MRVHLPIRAPRRTGSMAAFTIQGKQRSGLGMFGAVFEVIDADRLALARPCDERPIGLLHHDRNPAVIVTGLPDEQSARLCLAHRDAPSLPKRELEWAVGAIRV